MEMFQHQFYFSGEKMILCTRNQWQILVENIVRISGWRKSIRHRVGQIKMFLIRSIFTSISFSRRTHRWNTRTIFSFKNNSKSVFFPSTINNENHHPIDLIFSFFYRIYKVINNKKNLFPRWLDLGHLRWWRIHRIIIEKCQCCFTMIKFELFALIFKG